MSKILPIDFWCYNPFVAAYPALTTFHFFQGQPVCSAFILTSRPALLAEPWLANLRRFNPSPALVADVSGTEGQPRQCGQLPVLREPRPEVWGPCSSTRHGPPELCQAKGLLFSFSFFFFFGGGGRGEGDPKSCDCSSGFLVNQPNRPATESHKCRSCQVFLLPSAATKRLVLVSFAGIICYRGFASSYGHGSKPRTPSEHPNPH